MNIETKEICKRLKELSKKLELKAEAEDFLEWSEKDYIDDNVKMEKPTLRNIVAVEEPTKPTYTKGQVRLLMVVGFLCMFLPICFISLLNNIENLNLFFILTGVAFILVMVFIFGSVFLNQKLIKYEEKLQNYKDISYQNKENEKENESYPERIKLYNDVVSKCKDDYEHKSLEYKEILSRIEKDIEKYDGIIAPKFYKNIDDIVEIIEDGRADSLKEAINIFISDSRQKDLVKAQQEMNEIAEQQRWDAQRHNMAMEEQARRQADSIKQQEEARRRGAPNCWQCKNFPCGGDPAYCGSFVKK